MHFCKVCKNMYYIRLKGEDSNNLIYYCRKCGNEDETLGATLDNICVSKTQVRKIPCPNAACISNRPDEDKSDDTPPHEVIYLRYNDAALKFVYICNQCDTIWKSAESK